MRRKKLTDAKWLDMGKSDNDNRPVLQLVSYQSGHSVTTNGYSMHLVPGKTEEALDSEEMYEQHLARFPGVRAIWEYEAVQETIVRIDPNLLMDALHGMIDENSYEGIYIAIGKPTDVVRMWSPRTERKAAIMPMNDRSIGSNGKRKNAKKLAIPKLEEEVIA